MSSRGTATPHDPLAFAQAISVADEHGASSVEAATSSSSLRHNTAYRCGSATTRGKTTPWCCRIRSAQTAASWRSRPSQICLTRPPRHDRGARPVLLFDPSGRVKRNGVVAVGWSPLRVGKNLGPSRSHRRGDGRTTHRNATGDQGHWKRAAGALLATLFHAGAIMDLEMADIVKAINRRLRRNSSPRLGRATSYLAHDLPSVSPRPTRASRAESGRRPPAY